MNTTDCIHSTYNTFAIDKAQAHSDSRNMTLARTQSLCVQYVCCACTDRYSVPTSSVYCNRD